MLATAPDPVVSEPSRPARRAWILILLVTVAVAGAHLAGLDWHLPHHAHLDEKVLWLQLQLARGGLVAPADELLSRCYPPLLGRLAGALLPVPSTPAGADLGAVLRGATHDALGIRCIVALLSALIVPVTWLVARRFVAERTAILAAALTAGSTIAVWYSSQGRPHAVAAVWTTATVVLALRARASGRALDFVLAGCCCALATGTLHSGLCAAAAIAAAWIFSEIPRRGAPLVGLVLAAGLVLGSVFLFLRSGPAPGTDEVRTPVDGVVSWLGLGVHGIEGASFDGGGFVRLARALRDYEPVLTLLALGGAGAVLLGRGPPDAPRVRRGDVLTLAAHPILHITVFGAYGNSFQRFWFPILPYLGLIAAVGVAQAWSAGPGGRRRFLRLAVVAALGLQALIAAKIVALRVRADTHELAARWIDDHPDSGPFHVGPTVHLPLVSTALEFRSALTEPVMHHEPLLVAVRALPHADRLRLGRDLRDLPLRRAADRERLTRDPGTWIANLGPGVILVERVRGRQRRLLAGVHGELAATRAPSAAFEALLAPVPGAASIDYLIDGPHAPESWFAWKVLWASRLGPDIEVFALDD